MDECEERRDVFETIDALRGSSSLPGMLPDPADGGFSSSASCCTDVEGRGQLTRTSARLALSNITFCFATIDTGARLEVRFGTTTGLITGLMGLDTLLGVRL